MSDRLPLARQFLADAGWAGARLEPLSGDASFRRYFRVLSGLRPAILMDAPPGREDVRPFMRVGRALRGFGYSAPEIFAADPENGFLLLEDLGDDLYNAVIARGESEPTLYMAAIELLRDLHKRHVPLGTPSFDNTRAFREVRLFVEWTLPALLGGPVPAAAIDAFETHWGEILPPLLQERPVLTLFDFHAENLIWLPQRTRLRRIGLLDYQDAVAGAASYDVVSLLEDARRDVSPSVVQVALDHYLNGATPAAREAFLLSYALAGAQRNTRILGVFARLFLRDGKSGYLKLMPRVWGHLETDLASPPLAPLRAWFDRYVPAPLRRAAPIPEAFAIAATAS
ncbi:MAG: phosphotransferase [Proteobacteria bacterium]|nr:phosphotransferase [Pseudomonadota bacterium]MDA1058756.1 phosphotransferase [Pseudomonadota bacterium]